MWDEIADMPGEVFDVFERRLKDDTDLLLEVLLEAMAEEE